MALLLVGKSQEMCILLVHVKFLWSEYFVLNDVNDVGKFLATGPVMDLSNLHSVCRFSLFNLVFCSVTDCLFVLSACIINCYLLLLLMFVSLCSELRLLEV